MWSSKDTAILVTIAIGLLLVVIILLVKKNNRGTKILTVVSQYVKYALVYKSWQFGRDMKLILNSEGTIEEVNDTFKKCFGRTDEEITHERMSLIFNAPDLYKFENFKNLYSETDSENELEVVCVKKDLSTFPALVTVKKLVDDINQSKFNYGISIRNIQHRKDAEETLRIARSITDKMCQRTATALLIMNGGAWEWDLDTDLVNYDEGFRKIFGLWKGQIITSKDLMALVYKKDVDKVNAEMETSYENGSPYQVDYRLPRRNDMKDLIRCWADPIKNENKKVIGYNGAILLLQENVED